MSMDKNWTSRSPKPLACVCAHEYQDKRYGKGMRLHNPMKEKDGKNWRCTVCGRTQ